MLLLHGFAPMLLIKGLGDGGGFVEMVGGGVVKLELFIVIFWVWC